MSDSRWSLIRTEAKQQSPLLEMYELFAGLPSSVCTDTLSTARPKGYMCRQVMLLAGDPITETLLLTDGRAKITQVGESGAEVILRLVGPGEVIGEVGLVPGSRDSSPAQSLQNCNVLVWGGTTFSA